MSDTATRIQRNNGVFRELTVDGADAGPLAGRTFYAKDLFDVAGHTSGAGNPDWLKTHQPATRNAVVVDALLKAGARLIGKTITDEMAYSVDGINAHYGAPENPQYEERTSGGSSSGSASVVAAGLADFSIGSDTAGSVRIPASFCGLYGFRPTVHRVSLDGVVPLSPGLDTPGWFAREPELLRICGEAILGESVSNQTVKKLLVATDAFKYIEPEFGASLAEALSYIRRLFPVVEAVSLTESGWDIFFDCFRIVQSFNAWKAHSEWIANCKPVFEPIIQERFDFASRVTADQYTTAAGIRTKISELIVGLLPPGTVLCMPTTWDLPPRVDSTPEELLYHRLGNIKLTCVSPLSGTPQVTIPVRYDDEHSIGISFLAGPNQDLLLLELAESVTAELHKYEADKFQSSAKGSH